MVLTSASVVGLSATGNTLSHGSRVAYVLPKDLSPWTRHRHIDCLFALHGRLHAAASRQRSTPIEQGTANSLRTSYKTIRKKLKAVTQNPRRLAFSKRGFTRQLARHPVVLAVT